MLIAATTLSVAPLRAETTAFTGGTVHPVTAPVIEGGTVVVTDGKTRRRRHPARRRRSPRGQASIQA
jgi:hypothetical protein